MNKKIILLAAILALAAGVIAVVAQNNGILFNEIKDCKTITWDTKEPVYGTCYGSYLKCSDEPVNLSCTNTSYSYQCFREFKTITNSKQLCSPKSVEITRGTETGKIDFSNWGKCSTTEEAGQLTVICDSRYDGNNDGICQSGESCVKFVITGNDVKRYLKNSQLEFTEADESFFLEKLDYEVVSK